MKYPIGIPLNSEFRRRIQQINDTEIGVHVGNQIRLIEKLSKEHPHSISLVSEARPDDPETWRYNCYEFTFGLNKSEDCISLAGRGIFVNGEYVSWFINNYLKEITKSEIQNGDFIIYFSSDEIVHSGIWKLGQVRSKWGKFHTWDHDIDEVPSNYGNKVSFYRSISGEKCLEGFLQYAREKGQ